MLRMAGDLDTVAAPELRRLLREAAADTHGPVVLELSRVTFLNCPAVLPIVEARTTLGDRFWSEDPSRPVLLFLRLTRLIDSFQMLVRRAPVESSPARRRGALP